VVVTAPPAKPEPEPEPTDELFAAPVQTAPQVDTKEPVVKAPPPPPKPETKKPEAKAAPKQETKKQETKAAPKQETKKQETKAAPKPTTSQPVAGRLYLQLSAIDRDRAEVMADLLRRKNFPGMASAVEDRPGLYRVLVGPLNDNAVDAMRGRLDSEGFPGKSAIPRKF
jgi:outer membrane biosynthesis protein TonB